MDINSGGAGMIGISFIIVTSGNNDQNAQPIIDSIQNLKIRQEK